MSSESCEVRVVVSVDDELARHLASLLALGVENSLGTTQHTLLPHDAREQRLRVLVRDDIQGRTGDLGI